MMVLSAGSGVDLKGPADPAVTIPGVPGTDAAEPVEAATEAPGLPALAVALLLIFSCTTVSLAEGGPAGGEYQVRWVLLASDLVLGLVVLTQLRAVRELGSDRRHRCALAAAGLAVSLLPSLAVHPSARGGAAVLRWIGVAMVALAVGRLAGPARTFVLTTFAGVTAAQVAVALAERAAEGPIGLRSLGEPAAYEIGGRYASTGLTIHPYVLAAWCALGGAVLLAAAARTERPPGWLSVAAAVPFAGPGLTMSRTGALAVVLVLAAFGVAARHRPRLRLLVIGAVTAAALGVVLDLSGWLNRAAESAPAATPEASAPLTSHRDELLRQAWGLFRQDPVLGVGPGRYVEALDRRPELVKLATQRPSRPVHLAPYLVLVEGGLVVLPALAFLAWAVTTRSLQGGAPGVGVGVSLVPFLLLDHLNWSYPQGLLLTGLWLGALDQLAAPGNGRSPARPPYTT
jgi:hypothetical protein